MTDNDGSAMLDTMEAVIDEHTEPALTAHDRCDRCIAQAFVLMTKDGKSLMFCRHHGKKYTPTMAVQGWHFQDFSGLDEL